MFMKISASFVIFIFLVSCGGRAAHPVMVQQYGDLRKSCEGIERELTLIESEIAKLQPKTQKAGKNTALGVAGFFFIVPLFFMDLSKAEQEEIIAYRQRYNHLLILATEKKCETEREQIPEFKREKPKMEEDQDEN
ncbi:hypothetical protein MNBD_NITROSPINAE03-238 [hydrothermal vent metagenome]|uniref:Lipoprotein n=1 Tax=hydrothermal vent metagenome TaxID=652676 RepID=A0A3B1CM11_9ZZZZ